MAITVKIKSDFCFSYCENVNKVPFIEEIRIINSGTEDCGNMTLLLSAVPMFFQEKNIEIPALAAEEEYVISKVDLNYDAGMLANYTETVRGTFVCLLMQKEKCILKEEHPVELSPYDEMSNYSNDEILRAAFVTPNHPEITKLITKVNNMKGEKYGNYSIVGYTDGKDEVIRTVECIYEVIRNEEIAYVISKPGFTLGKQRVRLVDEVLREKQGNCMDLTCLFASLLEAAGLNPAIIILSDHAFVGVWTSNKHLSPAVIKDKEILKKLSGEDIILLECTFSTKGKNADYSYAVRYAFTDHILRDDVAAFIDICSAREEGVSPLPARMSDSAVSQENTVMGVVVPYEYPTEDEEESAQASENEDAAEDEKAQTEEPQMEDSEDEEETQTPAAKIPDKITRWKNKLLDLSAKSDLLNIKITQEGKRAVAIICKDAKDLYEKIKTGYSFRVEGDPEELDAASENGRILYTNYTDAVIKKSLAFMQSKDAEFRTQKGASILYMTFGSLRWFEKKNEKWYEAPLLMVPVEFQKEGQYYKVYYDGSDIQLNEAVLEMLKIRFELKPKGISPVPIGEDGCPDMSVLLKKLQAALAEHDFLEVYDHVHLGIFAFSQYLMWNDLDKNEEIYLSHPIVHSIEQGFRDPEVNEDILEFEEKDVFLPIPADGTQINAITNALGNQSFVLHGPPGTGKSQTITNMLANFIGYGRTVLFAAEKAAALQVVYNRMKGIGLDKFSLYLPVDSASKSSMERFLTQYREILEMAETEGTEYEELCEKIEKEKAQIEEQLSLYLGLRFAGHTLQELIENVLKNTNRLLDVSAVSDELLENIRTEEVAVLADQLKDTIHMGDLAGGVKDHPLRSWGTFEYKFGMQKETRKVLTEYLDILSRLSLNAEGLAEQLSDEQHPASEITIDKAYCEMLMKALEIPESLRGQEDLLEKIDSWIKWLDIQNKKAEITKSLDGDILELDVERMANKWKAIKSSSTTTAAYEKLVFKRQISKYIKIEYPTEKDITDAFVKALKLKELEKEVPEAPDFTLKLNKNEAEELRSYILERFALGIPETVSHCKDAQKDIIQKQIELLNEYEGIKASAEEVLGDHVTLWSPDAPLDAAIAECETWLKGLDRLREWHDYQKLKEVCVNLGMKPWIDLYENGEEDAQIISDFVACASEAMLREIFKSDERVQKFAGFRFDNLVAKYGELMERFYDVCGKEIQYRHMKRVKEVLADAAYEKDKVALKKIIESAGKGVTIRDVMARIPGFILKLTPCVMATPMTTSMYFPIDAVKFEHMILDEASQLQTCKSLGLIVRSENSIIVGDPNQMPPTSFFESSTPNYNLDVLEEDQESILKDFIALDMPDYYLKWHYRSNHESLIAFSNSSYYGGRMITFPADDQISHVRVIRTDGIYDRGQTTTNPVEAQTLVDQLEQALLLGDTRSYGIIAFNKRQQTLIEQLIEKRKEKNPEFAEKLREMESNGEGLFVRNLESVQGDERDVIYFSVGFGRDEDGKIAMAFGPLAKAGGWRRLNVAITRARDEMILFTSMDSDEMNISDTTSRGVRDLKNFIAYAEGKDVLAAKEIVPERETRSNGFADAICQYLEEQGYKYVRNAGNSALKIDIGVVDPEKEDTYLLGIMLNSNAITKAFNIYDSEIGQSKILKAQGWNLLRLWSLDWFEDSEREKKRITDKIKERENDSKKE